MSNTKLVAIHVDRRSAAIAVFDNTQLEHVESRHLSSDKQAAERTLVEFIRRKLAQFETDRVALQALPIDATARARDLHSALVLALREDAVSIWHVPESAILNAFGVPALTSRHQLYQTVRGIWPSLNSIGTARTVLGAAAVGLHFQTEHILSLAAQPE
jgi:hypothetical protein